MLRFMHRGYSMGIKEQLAALAFFRGGKGVDVSSVDEAQQKLGLSFAEDYREYVLAYGIASCNGHELTGISQSKRLDVVAATRRARELEPRVPDNLYLIEDANIDSILIWQDEQGTVWQTMSGAEPKRIADSLIDYLRRY